MAAFEASGFTPDAQRIAAAAGMSGPAVSRFARSLALLRERVEADDSDEKDALLGAIDTLAKSPVIERLLADLGEE